MLPFILRGQRGLLQACFKSGNSLLRPAAASIGHFTPSYKLKKDQPPVTTIILGWAWAKQFQVDRFAKIHQDLGHHTLTHTMDPKGLFTFDYEFQKNISEKLVEQVKLEDPKTKDVFLHVFSNNGYVLYQHLGKMLTEDEDLRLRGAILDSCPSPFTFWGYLSVRWAHVTSNVKWPLMAYIYLHMLEEKKGLFAALKAAKTIWPTLKANWEAYSSFHFSPGHHMLEERLPHPLLFFYSPRDEQMPAHFIHYCAQQQKGRGRLVHEENFGKSGHVAHHKLDPERYKKSVEKFTSECMSQS